MKDSDPLDPSPVQLNEPQTSRILSGVSYMDKLLVDVEAILTAASSQAFPKYKNPLTPVQIRVARDYIKRLRQQIIRVLQDVAVPLPPPKFDSTHSIRVTLQFIEVAIEEIAPKRLGGYGKVPETLISGLAGGLQEMKGIVRQLDSYLIQRPDADLNERVARLTNAGGTAELLATVSAVIDRHGFVEFRTPLQQIVDKIESPAYEIAFFGRVSTGKSSLLNRIIGTELLPTGVTPVTAVPTRIRNRSTPALFVWTAEGGASRYELSELAKFVTETKNAANHKRVTRLIAEVPLAILPGEVVLVDTPGLGSLALEGAAETLAYLPQCDLGVVLVEASSNLHSDDVATLDALRAASIPAVVVLSKADLVQTDDLNRLIHYTETQLSHQLGAPVAVTALSSRPENAKILEEWVADQITPRISDARHLAEQSNARKTAALAERILHALRMSMKSSPANAVENNSELKKAEAQLREAAGLIEKANELCFRMTTQIRDAGSPAIAMLVDDAVSVWQEGTTDEELGSNWIREKVNGVAQKASEELAAYISGSARKLSEALNIAAQATAVGPRNERIALETLIKELPPPDFADCSLQLTRPRSFSLSIGMARHSLKNRLESECGASLQSFFVSYARTLELWFRTVLGNLEREFNGHAEIYRAQLQRWTAPELGIQSSRDTVVSDVAALEKALDIPASSDQPGLHARA